MCVNAIPCEVLTPNVPGIYLPRYRVGRGHLVFIPPTRKGHAQQWVQCYCNNTLDRGELVCLLLGGVVVRKVDNSSVPKQLLTAGAGVAVERNFALELDRAADLPSSCVAMTVVGAGCFGR